MSLAEANIDKELISCRQWVFANVLFSSATLMNLAASYLLYICYKDIQTYRDCCISSTYVVRTNQYTS